MKRLVDIFRFAFISPEFAWVLGVSVLAHLFPLPLESIGGAISANDDVWKWLPTFPLIFAGVTFKLSSKVRSPLDKGNKQLYEWACFNRITDRLYAAYMLVTLSVISIVSIWIFREHLDVVMVGSIFIGSIGVSGFIALQVFLASQKIREILELHGEEV